LFFSPFIKQRLVLSARSGHNVVAECTDVACPGIDNLEACQENGNHDQNGREGNGKFRAYGSALIDFKNACFAG
jgi:hypothetical protein